MQLKKRIGPTVAGFCAGAVNGLFGAGGGMVLVPLLTCLTDFKEDQVFPASVSIILPVCLVSLSLTLQAGDIPWETTLLYLLGSSIGGILAGIWGRKLPTEWLHRILGVLILWGGIRYLC